MKNNLLGVAAASLMLVAAAGAHAQARKGARPATPPAGSAAAPATAVAPLRHGPPIAGLCIYSNTEVLQRSSVGQAFSTRMQQLRAQAAAEIGAQETALRNEEKVLQGKRATLSEQQFAQQAQPLVQREQQLNATAEQRNRDLQYTQFQQLQRISTAIQPLATAAYQAHQCSVLLSGDAVMAANPAMDISGEVTTALNARMSTITFDRQTAPAQ